MSLDFNLPELGENIVSGDVVNVLVREGDVIASNDGVIELETEKAVVEIPCPHAGKVAKIHVKKGQTVKVGQPVVSIEAEGGPEAARAAEAKPEKPGGEAESEKPREATGTKPSRSVDRPHPGPLPEGEGTKPAEHPHPGPLPEGEGTGSGVVPAGPEARRIARELGVDLSHVRGTGRGGRITTDDVRAATKPRPAVESTKPRPAVAPTPVDLGEPGEDAHGPISRQRMSKIRRTIAAQMVKSADTIPHVTNFDDADVTDLERLRKSFVSDRPGPAIKLSPLPFVVRAVALAVQQHPVVNASIDEEQEQIVYKRYVNLGIAVDTPRGLVVPVMRDADRLGVLQIAEQLATLTARARAAEFGLEELRGGTFTISNLGAIGGTYSTPIINHPEVAILLVGRSRWMPIVFEGRIESRLMMPLSLSYDHRVVDGAAAARFLNDVIAYLESPGRLLL